MSNADVREVIWTNPAPQGEGRRESLLAVMKAMIEGKEFDAPMKSAINDMWRKVLSGEKKLEHFSCLIEGREPPPAEGQEPPLEEEAQPVSSKTEMAENGDLFV